MTQPRSRQARSGGRLASALATPESKAPYVRRLFGTIAERYDLITRLLSFGLDARWKRRLVRLAGVRRGEHALDLASGTGDIAFELARHGARVVGVDITLRMIQLARRRRHPHAVRFLQGDMMALPFPDDSFDLVTTGYGLRNAPSLEPAIREIRRVLRPGGRLLSLDFERPEARWLRGLYLGYLTIVGAGLGFLLHGDPDTYRYIPASIRRYPGARRVARLLVDLGFEAARVHPVLGGLLAIHRAIMPSQASAPRSPSRR